MRITLLLFGLLFAQTLLAQRVEKAIEKLYKNFPQEKVILSFSKPEYTAGETIFFKAYVLTGYEPSDLSTNLYTEFYDRNKKLLDKQIVPLLKGSGDGSFVLPASIAEDVYYIRAYTHWMLNFDEAFQCVQPVHVYNPYSTKSLRPKPVQWTARAFAEGGNIVDDMAANIAVRLYAAGSLPKSWSGKLVEKNANDTVADVTVYNNEIGQVRFLPNTSGNYVLLLKDNEGHQQEVPLPKAMTNAIALQVVNSANKLNYAISFKGTASGGKGYRLIGTLHEQILFAATIAKSTSEVAGSINTTDYPAGVLQLTLFDEKETPVAERLCFLHQQSLPILQPAVSTDTLSFTPKGINRWQVAIDSTGWQSYALQVTDAAYPLENNFLGSLYWSSDFTNPVQNAEWYFKDVSEEKKAALDALLLTEKWERFQWNNILQDRFPTVRYPVENYLTYVGTVYKGNKLQPLREMNLIAQSKDSSLQFLQVKTDSAGNFVLPNIFFVDTVKIYYQPNKRKFMEGEVKIDFELKNRFYQLKKDLPGDPFYIDNRSKADTLPLLVQKTIAQRKNELVVAEKSKMMQEVVIRTKAKNPTEELDKKLSSGLFSSIDTKIFDFVNEDQTSAFGYSNILEWLQGRVAGFSIAYENGTPVPQIRNSRVSVYLDEFQVEPAQLNGVSPSDIAMIKVIKGSFAGGFGGGGGGAVVVYTRRGDMGPRNTGPSLPTNSIVGYKKPLVFPSLDYSQDLNKDAKDERFILYRNTLPQPNTTMQKATLRFYNNDSAKQYRLLITGFTQDGRVVYLDKVIGPAGVHERKEKDDKGLGK